MLKSLFYTYGSNDHQVNLIMNDTKDISTEESKDVCASLRITEISDNVDELSDTGQDPVPFMEEKPCIANEFQEKVSKCEKEMELSWHDEKHEEQEDDESHSCNSCFGIKKDNPKSIEVDDTEYGTTDSMEDDTSFADAILEGNYNNIERNEDASSEEGRTEDNTEDMYCSTKVDLELLNMPLPSGWIGLLHDSGTFVYLHQETRVITLSRPYAVGKQTSARRHALPAFAIPCLYQKLKKNRDRKRKVEDWQKRMSTQLNNIPSTTAAETGIDTTKASYPSSCKTDIEFVSSARVNSYLKGLFELCPLTRKEWKSTVIVDSDKKALQEGIIPQSLKGLPRITDKNKDGSWAATITGKSPVMMLNEYCQGFLKISPKYVELKATNVSSPFAMEVIVDNVKYGIGYGESKKAAKRAAAEKSLEILLPGQLKSAADFEVSKEHLKIFDSLDITDENVWPYSKKLNLETPRSILQTCLERNHGNDRFPSTYSFGKVAGTDEKKPVFQVVCGEMSVQGTYHNKRIARQALAQEILQRFHPHLSKWGSLLRLYSRTPSKIILGPQDNNECSTKRFSEVPKNADVLEALRKEMKALRRKAKEESHEVYPKPLKQANTNIYSDISDEKIEFS